MKIGKAAIFVFLILVFLQTTTSAQAQRIYAFPDAEASDPDKLGWMTGFPPPMEKSIRIFNYSHYHFPRTRWTFSHWRELLPTRNVFRGAGLVSPLTTDFRDLDALTFKDMAGNKLTWRKSLDLNYTDGILVLRKGKVVYEKDFGALRPERPHIAFSVTKSFVGTLAAMFILQGKLDQAALVSQYIPELKNSGFGDATVRQLLDMTTGVKFSEAYGDINAEITKYTDASSPMTGCPGYKQPKHFYEFLPTLPKESPHGEVFSYKTANTEVLAWILKRVSDKSLADLLSESIWSKIGAEQDAYFGVDMVGTDHAGAGLNTTLRDLARFGEMMRLNGYYNGQQIVPVAVLEDILRGGDKEKFARAKYATLPGWSYRNMWWISHNEHGAYMARGVYGQNIYIDPKAQMVIVRYASSPLAGNSLNDPVTLPAYMAAAKYLMQ
jgi:CubicO group peptidase (beta-lactamase class C family)